MGASVAATQMPGFAEASVQSGKALQCSLRSVAAVESNMTGQTAVWAAHLYQC